MAHDHHHHAGHDSQRRLFWTILLTGGFMVAEVVGGLLSGSLALLADAGHMLTDTAALVILATGWMPIDSLLSVLVALLILRSAWKLTRESGPILLEGPRRASTPRRCAARFPSSSRRSATCITCPSGR